MTKLTSYILLCLKGIAMGAADVIPGVSGGTIAFLTGIYEELLNSIKSVNGKAIKLLFSGKLAEFWKHINGTFLIVLFSGIAISFLTLARLMTYLLEHYPTQVWSFFFGLIIASAVYILKGIKGWKTSYIIALLIGAGIGATICLLSPSESTNELWYIFICGAIAICAMILPGISGSFILLLLGKYAYILSALNELNIIIIITFIAGAIIGLISFSHLLSWLLKKWHNIALCILSGFMLGSLVKIWPWQTAASRPTLPSNDIFQAIIFAILGASIVLTIEILSKKSQKNKEIQK